MKPRSLPVTVVVLSALILNGCHTMTRITLPDSSPPPPNAAVFAHLKAGDTVRVTIRTGEKVTFTLAEVQAEELVTKDGRHIPFRDMTQLEQRRFSGGKTAGLVISGVAVFFLILYTVVQVSVLTAWQ